MAHKFISEIQAGEQINDVFVVKDPILRSTNRGDLYIAMYLLDRTGQLNGRMWQATEAVYRALPKPGFVRIQGRSELYQNNLQVVVNNVSVVEADDVDLDDFLAKTKNDVKQMFEEVKKAALSIKNPQLKSLVGEFIGDVDLMKKFCKVPAAVMMHHNYLGGLLEHTHNMLRVAGAILPLYPKVQSDLVIAGIILHDMGKTEELTYDMAFSYTDTGQLVGHISMILVMLHKKAEVLAAQGKAVDSGILDALGHILLSHHGQYAFGSPKLPATPEAFMVCYIDDLDAKMNQVAAVIENEPGDSDWTSYQRPLETYIYRRRLMD
jgi:3'-5' exoribonuclease